jgi:hypothetical protein
MDIATKLFTGVFSVKEKLYQTAQLWTTVEETKLWLRDVKDFITEMIDTRINFCSLPDLVDTVNAMQIFFYSNFIYPDASTKISVDTSPEWYRMELLHSIKHVEQQLATFLIEMDKYKAIAIDSMLADDLDETNVLREIRKQLKKKNSNCRRFGDYYREAYKNEDWDICKECTKRNLDVPTISQIYSQIANDPKLFTDLQTRISSKKPISDVTLPKSFRTTLSGDAHEMHLGDDTITSDSKSDSESRFSRWFI